MSMKNKAIVNEKSSQKVAKFLEKNNLHKKDFAQMIGVTLSYVYNLIDETIPFSSRATTLERIATVMDIRPEDFIEYQIPQDPPVYNENLEFLKDTIKHNNLSTVEFLKMFGIESLKELPKLPKYKLDENRQIVIDEIIEEGME